MYNVHISCEPAYYGVIGRKWSNDQEGWREEWMYETSDYAEALSEASAYEPIDILDVSVWEMDALPEPVCQKLPECKNLRISIIRKRVPFKLPPSVLKLRNLKQLSVTGSTQLIALPPSLKLDSLFVHCIEAPYWLLLQPVSTLTVYVNNTNSWTIPLEILRDLLKQSLSKQGSLFWRWLTRGLYDPRLLIKIRDFLLYFSNVYLPSLSYSVIHAWRTVSELRVAHADLVVDPESVSSQSTTCTGIVHAPDSVPAMADEGPVRSSPIDCDPRLVA